jgi:hypothetical protein
MLGNEEEQMCTRFFFLDFSSVMERVNYREKS